MKINKPLLFILLNLITIPFKGLCNDNITIYFVPFDIHTYSPITNNNIKEYAWEKWEVDSKDKVMELKSIIKNNEKKYDFNKIYIRSIIYFKDKTIYLDTKGVASDNLKTGVIIDKEKFIEFGRSLKPRQKEIFVKSP